MKRIVASLGACLFALLAPPTAGQEAGRQDPDALPPEVEVALREFSKEGAESRRESFSDALDRVGESLATEVKLDPAAKAKLADHYPAILEETHALWQDRFQEWLRTMLKRYPDPTGVLEGWDAEQMAGNQYEIWARADRTEAWKEALADALNPAQLARYEANEQARRKKAREEVQEFVNGNELYAIQIMTPMMEAEVNRLQQLAGLDEARVNRLRAAMTAAIEEIAETWSEDLDEKLLELEDDQRKERVRSRRFFSFDQTASENQPKEHQLWKEALAGILTGPEREQLAKRRTEIRMRRTKALAMVLVEAVDPYLGFTGDQRTRLAETLSEPLLGLDEHYFVVIRPGSHYPLNPGRMFAQAAELDEAELRKILDEGQTERWLALPKRTLVGNYRVSTKDGLADLEVPSEDEMDEFAARRLIARYLHHQSMVLIEEHAALMQARSEAVARVANLTPAQRAVLKTAAKGAAQEAVQSSLRQIENFARSLLQSVPPKDLADRLKRQSGPYISSQSSQREPKLLTKTIERILTPSQRSVWTAAKEEAESFERECRLAVVLTELEKAVLLTEEQQAALRELFGAVLNEYRIELDQSLSSRWHLEGYYSQVPVAMLSDEQLEAVLDKEEVRAIRSQVPGHLATTIQHIKERRDKRRKEDKP